MQEFESTHESVTGLSTDKPSKAAYRTACESACALHPGLCWGPHPASQIPGKQNPVQIRRGAGKRVEHVPRLHLKAHTQSLALNHAAKETPKAVRRTLAAISRGPGFKREKEGAMSMFSG